MHNYDWPKFYEAMTLFSAAAACEGLGAPLEVFAAGLRAFSPAGAPHAPTMALLGLPPSPAGARAEYRLRYESGWAAPRLHVRVAGGWRPLEAAAHFQREEGSWVVEVFAPPGAAVAVLPFCGKEWDHPPGGGEYALAPGVTALARGALTRPA